MVKRPAGALLSPLSRQAQTRGRATRPTEGHPVDRKRAAAATTQTPERPHSTKPPEDLSFPAWARSTWQQLRKAAGVGSLIAAAIAISFLDPTSWPRRWWDGTLNGLMDDKTDQRAMLAFVQAAACFLLALLTPRASIPRRQPLHDQLRRDIAATVCRRVQLILIALFSFWSLYYAVTGLALLGQSGKLEPADRAFIITLSSITSLLLYWLYLELAELTVEGQTREQITPVPGGAALSDPTRRDINVLMIAATGLLLLIVGLSWYGFAKLSTGAKEYEKVLDAMDLAVACFSGVGLCLVVGRFGSKHLDPGPVTLFGLYFYAVIQPGAAMFGKDPLVHLAVTTLALPLKVLLWLVCVWAFTTGVLGEYVYELRLLVERVEERRSRVGD